MTRAHPHSADGGRRSVEESNVRTPDPDAVRDALRALAAGTAPSERPAHRETIADATAAAACAVEAAAFLDDGRLSELARAVAATTDDASSATGDDAPPAADASTTTTDDAPHVTAESGASLAERGAAALETLRRLDAAARSASERASGANHFHPVRGTVLPQTGQATDR